MMLPTLTNGTSHIAMSARDVHRLAHNAIAQIEASQQQAALAAAKECLEEECVHRIPVLGIPYYRHKRYPTVSIAMEHAPEVQSAKHSGWGDRMICEKLKKISEWLINDSGYPEDKQTIHISVNDFYALV